MPIQDKGMGIEKVQKQAPRLPRNLLQVPAGAFSKGLCVS
jgi:hypothetical protein